MRKSIKISLLILFLFAISLFQISPVFSAEKQSGSTDKEISEEQTLLSKQNKLRRSFLSWLQSEAKKVRSELESATTEEEKKKVTERFQAERLQKIEEFQVQDEALNKQIQSTRLKK